ncbi:sigma-70 family RNA polymerase sigma factor [Burkholderia sp. AU33545]|uniref:sigma-70 family RNA polymerase sigma factor n=1 Tax=Burkholderia sp. AU33545 TaxID=2879631 RepID=UPI001CF5EAE8|nr:sigma-70 family RNA polymerase sigma factor [Burkholderia sp. AU33545]MCA8203110.1 sigma-70 family RNA polymerase sigma factor [Burkholderia sp. AU33545]
MWNKFRVMVNCRGKAVEHAKIEETIRDLVADYDRCDGLLSKAQVERLLEKRKLSVEDGAEIYRQLDLLGITPEDESESRDAIDGLHIDGSVDEAHDVVSQRLDVRLRNMSSKLLNAEEEIELGRRMELGRRARQELDSGVPPSGEHSRLLRRAMQAKDTMVVANLRLVLHVARPYVGLSDLNLEDLFQEGTLGLIRAAEKFDHTLGYKFSTYATWWIRQSITRALADRGATIRLPVYVYDEVVRLKRADRILSQAHPERRPSIKELADELAWDIEKVHFIQQAAALIPLSLDEQLGPGADTLIIETLMSDLPSPEQQLGQTELAGCVDAVLRDLKEREGQVLRLRFGLNDQGTEATLEEIGQMFGLTRERIRQIESKAIERLKHPNRSTILRDFL